MLIVDPVILNKHNSFFVLMQSCFLNDVLFSFEATIHINGCDNRHNVRIWGSQHPHEIFEKEQHSPKVNIWCDFSNNK